MTVYGCGCCGEASCDDYDCPGCVRNRREERGAPAPADEGQAESGEQALESANEAYRELRAAVHSQLDASGIYMDGDAEDVITEALIEHAEADRKVSCPRCAQWSWHGPDAERKVIEHWERAHAQPPAPEPPDAATVLAGLRALIAAALAECERREKAYEPYRDEFTAQPPAPITAEDVAPALSAWFRLTAREQLEWLDNNKPGHGEAAFVADYLNRRH